MSGYFLDHIDRMAGYVPGEQPQGGGVTKLNTNENPYPPSPRVAEAISRILAGDRLRLYPDPSGMAFRRVAADLHGVEPDMILPGNGSDELLTILTRAFVGPGDLLAYPSPSYILYKTLAEIQGARPAVVEFRPDWTLDPDAFAATGARLSFLANPNSPSGTALRPDQIGEIAGRLDGPLVVDEAYANFAETDAIGLIRTHPNVIVSRTLSKGYGLAGLRFGYLIARPEIVAGLNKVKDSYNCDALSLAGATAALEDQENLAETRSRILATRARLQTACRDLGYHVPDSQANFVWCTGGMPAASTYERLKARNILVRLMRYPGQPEGIRITVGTDAEIDLLLQTLRTL
ncbi:histidinol-phosphate transaminase [Tundrisphaera sp. TA3]|uniref:histidinol-phosphate transaminase n=1 Tax=Tundrisphaera sp. TA3 TaxID=3435775 RepID=UPI003EBC01BA